MARSTSIGERAGVGVADAVVIVTDCRPDEVGMGSQEVAIGLPRDDWREPRPDGAMTVEAGGGASRIEPGRGVEGLDAPTGRGWKVGGAEGCEEGPGETGWRPERELEGPGVRPGAVAGAANGGAAEAADLPPSFFFFGA